MKKDIHPQYFETAKAICACGNQFTVGATIPEIRVEICSSCHPFYTGKEKVVDVLGKVERFRERISKKTELAKVRGKKKERRARREELRKERAERLSTYEKQITERA